MAELPNPITLNNFHNHANFPQELRLQIYENLLAMTVLGSPPPILFALHGTPDYELLKRDYERQNFLITNASIEQYRRLGYRNGLGKIRYLHIRIDRAFQIYNCPLRAHMSKTKNNFIEINIETGMVDQINDVRVLSNTYSAIRTVFEMAKMSRASRTTVRVRFGPTDPKAQELVACMDKLILDSLQPGATRNGKSWRMGRREFRGVDGALYAPREKIWIWEAEAEAVANLTL